MTGNKFEVWPVVFLFFTSLIFLCYGIEHQNLILSVVAGAVFFWSIPILIIMFCQLLATPFPEEDDNKDDDGDEEPWYQDPDSWKHGIKLYKGD